MCELTLQIDSVCLWNEIRELIRFLGFGPSVPRVRCRTNKTRIRHSRPDSGLDFQANVLEPFRVVPSALGSGPRARPHLLEVDCLRPNMYHETDPSLECRRARRGSGVHRRGGRGNVDEARHQVRDWAVESQLPHKTVNLIFGFVIVNSKLTILWGN